MPQGMENKIPSTTQIYVALPYFVFVFMLDRNRIDFEPLNANQDVCPNDSVIDFV